LRSIDPAVKFERLLSSNLQQRIEDRPAGLPTPKFRKSMTCLAALVEAEAYEAREAQHLHVRILSELVEGNARHN
jgi:hypothetical protein